MRAALISLLIYIDCVLYHSMVFVLPFSIAMHAPPVWFVPLLVANIVNYHLLNHMLFD